MSAEHRHAAITQCSSSQRFPPPVWQLAFHPALTLPVHTRVALYTCLGTRQLLTLL